MKVSKDSIVQIINEELEAVLSEKLSEEDFKSKIRSNLSQLAAFRSGLEAMAIYTKRIIRDRAVQVRRNPNSSQNLRVEIERLRLSVQPFAGEIVSSYDETLALEKQIIVAAGLGDRMEREMAGSEMEARNSSPMASHIKLDGKAIRRTYGTPYALADDVLTNMLQILDGDALQSAHNSALEAAYNALDAIQAQGMDLSAAPNIQQFLETFESTAVELKQAANSEHGGNIADLMYIVDDFAKQEAERANREFEELEAEEQASGISDSDAFMMGVEDAKNPQPTMDGGSVGEIYDHGRDRFEGYPRLLQSYLQGIDYVTGDNVMEEINKDYLRAFPSLGLTLADVTPGAKDKPEDEDDAEEDAEEPKKPERPAMNPDIAAYRKKYGGGRFISTPRSNQGSDIKKRPRRYQESKQMKITKEDLMEIINEEMDDLLEAEDEQAKLTTKSLSTTQRQKIARDRIKTQGAEFSSVEQGLVDQLEGFISKLASQPGVDLMQHRTLLQRALDLLQKQIKGDQ